MKTDKPLARAELVKYLKKLSSVMTDEDKAIVKEKVFKQMLEFDTRLFKMLDEGKISSTAAKKIKAEGFKNNPLWHLVLFEGIL